MEVSDRAVASRYYLLTEPQKRLFKALMSANVKWTYTITCASWASDVVLNVIGADIDADDNFGFETPRDLGESILELELRNPTSRLSPKRVTRNPASTIQTSRR